MNSLSPSAFSRAEEVVPMLALGALGQVEVRLSVEVGAARLTLNALSAITPGATFELDRRTDEQVDILVNDRLLAKGEVVAIGDRFGVRILTIVAAEK